MKPPHFFLPSSKPSIEGHTMRLMSTSSFVIPGRNPRKYLPRLSDHPASAHALSSTIAWPFRTTAACTDQATAIPKIRITPTSMRSTRQFALANWHQGMPRARLTGTILSMRSFRAYGVGSIASIEPLSNVTIQPCRTSLVVSGARLYTRACASSFHGLVPASRPQLNLHMSTARQSAVIFASTSSISRFARGITPIGFTLW